MEDHILAQLLLQAILISLNALFACAEIAVISMNDTKLAQLAARGDKRAVRLARLTSQPAKFLATIQVAITLSGFLGSAFAADNFSGHMVTWLLELGVRIPEKTLDTIAVIVITIILSYFTLVFGELVPKRVAMKKAETLALGMSLLITFISKLFAPVVWLLTVSTNGMLRLFGIDPDSHEEKVTEEEIRMMVDAGSEKGTIDIEEKELIQNVFEFDDLTAGEIATHRTDIALLWTDETVSQWENTIHNSRHTYYPVCEETVDNVVGVLNAKKYFRIKEKTRENIMKEALKPAYFVPETVKADVLFKNMKKRREYFAVVLDEYGGMNGIVTITDLLECLVGDFDYEDNKPGAEIKDIEAVDSRTWRISGGASMEEVEKALEMSFDRGSYETFGGYVLSLLDSVPEDGATVNIETDKLSITVSEIKDHRIERTLVCKSDNRQDKNEFDDNSCN